MPDFLPRRQLDLLAWTRALLNTVLHDPAGFGLTPELVAQYQVLVEQAEVSHAVAVTAATRTSPSIAKQNDDLDALRASTRSVVALVRATPGITQATLAKLNLSPRDASPSRIGPPAVAPQLMILSKTDDSVRVQLIDADSPTRKARPAGVAGAVVFAFVGDEPPTAQGQWRFMATATRTRFDVTFGADVPRFSTVWLTASWFNPRGQHSPLSTPISTQIIGGVPQLPRGIKTV
jgi:hypothetical protein